MERPDVGTRGTDVLLKREKTGGGARKVPVAF